MSEQNYNNVAGNSTQEATLRDILMPVFRRRRLVILTFGAVFLGALLVAVFWAANYYEASMQILVQEHRADPSITPSPNSAVGPSGIITPDQISSEVALLQGTDMLRTVADTCGLAKPRWHLLSFLAPSDPAARKEYELARATKKLAKDLDVEAEKTADVIDVTYGHRGDPEVPACVLNKLSQLYVSKHLNSLARLELPISSRRKLKNTRRLCRIRKRSSQTSERVQELRLPTWFALTSRNRWRLPSDRCIRHSRLRPRTNRESTTKKPS